MPTLKKQETAYLHVLGQVIQREFGQSAETTGHRRSYNWKFNPDPSIRIAKEMYLVNSRSWNGNHWTRHQKNVGEPESISTVDGSVGCSKLWLGLNLTTSFSLPAALLSHEQVLGQIHTLFIYSVWKSYAQSGSPAQEMFVLLLWRPFLLVFYGKEMSCTR